MATAKHKFQRLVFNPANQKLIEFLHELQKLAKDAIGVAAQDIIEQFIYAKKPPHLKKSINQAHLENGTYEQNCITSRERVKIEWFRSPRSNADKYRDATSHTTKPRINQTNLPPLQKTRSLPKPMPSTQTRKRPSPKQHEYCRQQQ